jgi:hypothetical protein
MGTCQSLATLEFVTKRQSLCLLWTTFLEVLYTVHSLFNMPKFVSLLALKDTI